VTAQIPTNGLVGYWPFNSNANDESGNGNNGTVSGATVTTDRFGNPNSAYSFDGINDYIATNYSGILGKNSRTISIWLKRELPNIQTMYCLAYGGHASNRGNTFRCGFNFSNTAGVDIDVSNGDILYASNHYDGLWHHYVWVVPNITDPKLTDVRIYEDGELLTEVINYGYNKDWCENTSINTEELYKLLIGDFYDDEHNSHFYFSGDIDDIRIYNRALNEQEIQVLHNENACYRYITVYDTTIVTVIDTNYVTIVDTNYISVTDTLIINAVLTGLNPPNNLNTIKVYPNPAKDKIYIHTGKNYSLMADYSIKIINSQGQPIFDSKITEQIFEIDVSTFGQTGLYFLQLYDPVNQLIEVRKIILQ
jgi:hypothetical protein